jgi:hypothetical protein
MDTLRFFSNTSMFVPRPISDVSRNVIQSDFVSNILMLVPLLLRAIDALVSASSIIRDVSLTGGYAKTVRSSENNLGKDLLHRIALDEAQVHMREMTITSALLIELKKIRLIADILTACLKCTVPNGSKEDALSSYNHVLLKADEAHVELFKRLGTQETLSKSLFEKAVTTCKHQSNIWRIYAAYARSCLYFSAARSSLYRSEYFFHSARTFYVGVPPYISLISKLTSENLKIESRECVNEARHLLSKSRELCGESHRTVISIESGRLEECIGNVEEARKRYGESFSMACTTEAATSGRASSGMWRTCSSYVSFETRNGKSVNAVQICVTSITTPGCVSSGRLWAYLAQSVASLNNKVDIAAAEEILRPVLQDAVKEEDSKRENPALHFPLPTDNYYGISTLQALPDVAPFSYQNELKMVRIDDIDTKERKHLLLALVVRCGLVYAPKSGELWTEAGRVLLNPVSLLISRPRATLCFKRSCELTQQYGDAFFERIRASLLPVSNNVSSAMASNDIDNTDSILREATASSPNYGPCWTALSSWVAFECRETSLALMTRAKRLLLSSLSSFTPKEEENTFSSLSLILPGKGSMKKEEDTSIVDFCSLTEVYCDDLS